MPPTAQPFIAKPQALRYRRGKLPPGVAPPTSDTSDEDESEDELQGRRDERAKEELVAGGAGRVIQKDVVGPAKGKGKGKGKEIQIALRDVKVEQGGEVYIGGKREVGRTAEEESESEESSADEAGPAARARPAVAAVKREESEYETESEEETSEESENEPEPPKPVYRPTFVPKRARETVLEREAIAKQQEEAERKKVEELESRKKESRELVGETIRREMAEREAPDLIPDVDDTDDVDPEAEFQLWRLRELSRLARDKQRALEREEEREEIERRRALPAAQRDAEDEEYARRTREEAKDNRGERAFLEKFWHKGAFHQDEEILKRNYNVKLESTVDVSLLPKVMQVRNFGKMSRTKYTHLKDQDTTQDGWGTAARTGPGGSSTAGQGCFNCGGPHLRRDCPNPPQEGSRPPGTGTNNSALGSGSRSWGGDRDNDRSADRYGGDDRSDRRNDRDRDVLDYAGRRERDRSPARRRPDDDDRVRHGDKDVRDRDRDNGQRRDDPYRRDDRERRRSRSRSPFKDDRERYRRR